jgi:Leucine-rich repeat (LRR) protein
VCSWGGVTCSGGRVTSLYLYSTQVTGDVAGLASLSALQTLDLYSTQVTGDVAGLAPLSALQTLHLSSTQVTGDVRGVCSSCTSGW